MRKTLVVLGALLAGVLAAASANAQQALKVGVVMSYSGQFADPGAQIDNGIKLYMKQNGDTVAGRKIELIRKDSGGVAPDVAKRLSQEVIVRDGAEVLAGYDLTPNALAAADVSAQAKQFMVNMNAATSVITTKSPYMVRTSFTVYQLNEALGAWAYKNGVRRVYTLVSDFGPGHDGEAAFHRGFKDAGGEIIGSARYPVANLDFTAFLQRAKDANPDGIYIWVPGGPQPAAIGKAIAERGIDKSKVKIMGQGELTYEDALKSMGDAGLGLITAFHYDYLSPVGEEQGVRRGLQRRVQAQPGHVLGRRLRRHARAVRGAEEDRGQGRCGGTDQRGERHELGKPARADANRSRNPRRGPDCLHPPRRETGWRVGQRRVRQDRQRQGPVEGAPAEVVALS